MSSNRWIGLIVCAIMVGAATCQAQLAYTGVNLAGAEFGGNIPGTYNSDYTYPYLSEADYFIEKGMNTIRLPFRWERLQPTLNGAFNAAELARMDDFVEYATGEGAYVVLDPHNYARYRLSGVDRVIGSAQVPHAAFGDFWKRLATHYKDNDHVIFGLMNEPNTMGTQQWLTAANTAIDSIRDEDGDGPDDGAGATNLILVPGNAWTGAHSWNQDWYDPGDPNGQVMLGVVDPLDNYAYEVHQYLDHDSIGGTSQIGQNGDTNDPNEGIERLTSFTNWLIANDRRGFLGEFGVANSRIGTGAGCTTTPCIGDETLDNMLDYMEANSDHWIGWTWWAAGPWWGGGPSPAHENQSPYLFLLDPANLGDENETDKPAMGVLQPHLTPVVSGITGDYNGDGKVSAADFTVWRDNIGAATLLNRDLNNAGPVGDDDFDSWKDNYSTGFGSASGNVSHSLVPEPSTIGLIFASLGLLGLFGWPMGAIPARRD